MNDRGADPVTALPPDAGRPDSPLPGMPSPSPVPAGTPTAIVEPSAPVPDAAVDAALTADAEWARTHPCGPTWTRPPREQVRRLIAAEWARAEAAEANLAALKAHCRESAYGNTNMWEVMVSAGNILAIIGTREARDGG